MVANSETEIGTEEGALLDEVEEKVSHNSARKATTVEHTQELLQLFFEVK